MSSATDQSLLQSTEAKLIQLSLDHIREAQHAQAESLRRIGASLETLVKLEQAQGQILEKLREGSERMNKTDMRVSTVEHELGKRITDVERDMPGLIELRKWVIGGVLAGLGMMGVALLKLVLVDPVNSATRITAAPSENAVLLQKIDALLLRQLPTPPVSPPQPTKP